MFAAVAALTGALLTGCTNGSNSAVPSRLDTATHANRGASWMRAGAKLAKRLLYVSDQTTNSVFVYDYPSGTEVGDLTGMDEPSGQCVDARGDVYVTNSGSGETDEFAHGGTAPIATFNSKGYPAGCSVDAAGDLAVTNTETPISGGNIYVWTGGKGHPKTYQEQHACYYLWAASYDDQGNLVAQAEYDRSGTVVICAVLKGAKRMTVLPFNATIEYAGDTTWDGKYFALDVQGDTTSIIRATLRGSKLIEKGVTNLYGNCRENYLDIVQPFIVGAKNTPLNRTQGTQVVGGNLLCSDAVDIWKYPAGGSPHSELESAPAYPVGESVSIGS